MDRERDSIEEILRSVAEGARVDWDAALHSSDGADRERVESLRAVARIAEFSRRRIASAGSESASDAGVGALGDGTLPERWGDLLLLERIGSGAHSDVARAWDPKLQREVALKLLRADAAAGAGNAFGAAGGGAPTPLEREGRAAARVRHPHVVAIHGVDRRDGRVGLWMEYVKGATLEQEVARRGPLPVEEVARLAREIGSALVAVHAAGVLHRDVKPANVVRDAEGRFVLVDFGLGMAAREGAGAAARGTPLYMAPETLAGGAPTVRSELYSFALTLRFALVGRHTFEAADLDALRAQAAAGAPSVRTARADVDPAFARIVDRAGAADPLARFASAQEFVAALEGGGAAPGAEAGARRGRRAALATAVVGIVVVVAAAWIARTERNELGGAPERTAATAMPATTPATTTTGDATNATTAISPGEAYSIDASFLLRGSSGESRRLRDGDRLALGDRLSLEVHASRPVWTYVLNEDDRGARFLLFPQPMFDRTNPLPPDSLTVLPGTIEGRENAWTVTSRGGRERFLVVVSPEPVAELEADLGRIPAPEQGRPIEYAAIASATVERLRGVGGVEEVPASAGNVENGAVPGGSDATARLFARFRALAGPEEQVRGVWVRQIELENPIDVAP